MTTKSILQNVGLIGAAILVFLVGAELFLRIWPQLLSEEAALRIHWRELGEDIRNQGLTVPDPHFGFLYRPNLNGRIGRQTFEFTLTTDEKGFRNPSPWPKQADIVVVGDSMAFGYGVDDADAWVRLVQDELPETKIINLGLIGSGPEQYLRVLQAFGLELAPKLVMLMLFPGNDLADAEHFRAWLEAGTEVPFKEWQVTERRPSEPGTLRALLEGSYLFAFVRDLRRSLRSPLTATTVELEGGNRLQLVPTVYSSQAEMARPGHPVFELVMATLEEARAVSNQHGSEFVVLLMPTKEEVYLPLLEEAEPALTETFRTALEERGMSVIDLTPYFQAQAGTPPLLFFEVDGHPNEEGYRLVADVVAEHLRNNAGRYGLWQ